MYDRVASGNRARNISPDFAESPLSLGGAIGLDFSSATHVTVDVKIENRDYRNRPQAALARGEFDPT